MSARRRATVRPPRWKVTLAIGEGLRNWRSGRWLTFLATVFVTAAMTVPAVTDGLGISRLVEDERAWERAGGRMLVITNDTAGGIDRIACELTARVNGVAASASLTRLPVRAGVPNAPNAALAVVSVSEGIGPLLGLEPSAGGAILPHDVADGIGVKEGSSVRLTAEVDPGDPSLATMLPDGPITVDTVADTSVLGNDYAYAVLLPASASGLASMCMVRVEPGYVEPVRAGLPAMLSVAGQDAIVADRLVGGEYARNFSAEYATRGLEQSPWLVGGAISLLWLLLAWMRRGREGLYATLGADRPTRTIVRATEGLALVGTSALLAAVVTSCVLALTATQLGAVVNDTIRHFTISTSVAVLGVLVSTLLPFRSPLAALKDR